MRKLLVAVIAASLVSPVLAAKPAEKAPLAAGEKKPGKGGVRGAVVKVDGDKLTIKSGGKDAAKEVVIATDANTKIKDAEGKDLKLADLKEGTLVMVSPAEGTAQTITVAPAKKPKA
jgi:hypothetical protein